MLAVMLLPAMSYAVDNFTQKHLQLTLTIGWMTLDSVERSLKEAKVGRVGDECS